MKLTAVKSPSLRAWRCSANRHVQAANSRAPFALRCSSSSFNESLSKRAREAQRKFERWAEQERVKERLEQVGRSATSKVQEAFESVQDGVSRTAAQLDRDYDVKSKAQRAAGKVREVADDVESKYGVWRKTQILYQDALRKWPTVCFLKVLYSTPFCYYTGSRLC